MLTKAGNASLIISKLPKFRSGNEIQTTLSTTVIVVKNTLTYNVSLYLVAFLLPILVSVLLSKALKAHPELH